MIITTDTIALKREDLKELFKKREIVQPRFRPEKNYTSMATHVILQHFEYVMSDFYDIFVHSLKHYRPYYAGMIPFTAVEEILWPNNDNRRVYNRIAGIKPPNIIRIELS